MTGAVFRVIGCLGGALLVLAGCAKAAFTEVPLVTVDNLSRENPLWLSSSDQSDVRAKSSTVWRASDLRIGLEDA